MLSIEEINSIEKNQTWDLASLPQGQNLISVKWVYKSRKIHMMKYKTRWWQRITSKKSNKDYYEVFALVIRMKIIKLIISIASQNNWSMYQIDIKFIFLNDFLEEELYI